MRQTHSLARLAASAAVTAIVAAALGGCQTMSDVTGSIMAKPEMGASTDPKSAVDALGDRYRANPKDADAALAYGQALRANGQRAQAAAVLEQASIAHPGNKAVLAAWGRALADNGNFQQAFDVLSKAHSPANPDWRILSVQGTVLDQLGRHDDARRYYEAALKIVPGEPSVLSNFGLSYMLTKELPKAEEMLREAYASARGRTGPAEPGARDRPAGPLRGGRNHRQGRPAGRRGGGQRRLSEADAQSQGQCARRSRACAGGGANGLSFRSDVVGDAGLRERARPAPAFCCQALEHDPEKWKPVFREDHAQTIS